MVLRHRTSRQHRKRDDWFRRYRRYPRPRGRKPRILLEDLGKSYHATNRVTERDIFDNRLKSSGDPPALPGWQ
jgi:hypothetical protein